MWDNFLTYQTIHIVDCYEQKWKYGGGGGVAPIVSDFAMYIAERNDDPTFGNVSYIFFVSTTSKSSTEIFLKRFCFTKADWGYTNLQAVFDVFLKLQKKNLGNDNLPENFILLVIWNLIVRVRMMEIQITLQSKKI